MSEETMVNEVSDEAVEEFSEEPEVAEEDDSEEIIEESPEDTPKQEASEPGYVKKRVNEAVEKAIARTRAEMQAEFERQLAPLREKQLNDEARELVRSGEFKSLDRAKEYLQLKQGVKPEVKEEQPRNDKGQFTPKGDPEVSARVKLLAHQADTIKAKTGVDVMEEYRRDPELKEKLFRGEIDFYDVAETMKSQKKRPPSPMRSPNGASGKMNSILNMSKEEFARFEKRLDEGVRFRQG